MGPISLVTAMNQPPPVRRPRFLVRVSGRLRREASGEWSARWHFGHLMLLYVGLVLLEGLLVLGIFEFMELCGFRESLRPDSN